MHNMRIDMSTGKFIQTATLIIGLVLLSTLSACSSDSPDKKFQELSDKAATFEKEEKFEEARISLLAATQIKPKDAQTYYRLGEAYVRLRQIPKALDSYRTAINLDPEHRDARLRIASMMLLGGEQELAESDIRKILEKNPNDIEALILLSSLERARNNVEVSKKILDDLFAKEPNNVLVLGNLAQHALQDGKLDEAEKLLVKATEQDESNKSLRLALADIYIRQARTDDARKLVSAVLESDPKNSTLRFFYGEFLLSLAQEKEAMEQFQQTLEIDPGAHKARDHLYDMFLAQRNSEGALALTSELVKNTPEDPAVTYFQARDLELQGKPQEARKMLLKAVEAMRNFAPAFRRLGLIELALGESGPGLEHLNQAVAIDPADVGARLALGRFLLLQKQISESKKHAEAVLQKFPRQIGANILRADIALIEGDKAAAKQVYELLASEFPNTPIGFLKLAILEESEGNVDRAIELYRKGLVFDQNVLIPARRLIGLLIKKDGIDAAITQVKTLREQSQQSQAEYETLLGLLELQRPNPSAEQIKSARGHFSSALEKRPDLLLAYFALGRLDSVSGDLKAAVSNYEKLVELQPKHIPTRMLLALSQEQLGNAEKAAEQYRAILEQAPRFGPAANNLAYLLSEKLKGDLDEALRLAEIAKAELPNEPSVSDTLGWIYHLRGSSRAALPYLEEAVGLLRRAEGNTVVSAEILYHLGMVRKTLGEKGPARSALEEAKKNAAKGSAVLPKIESALGDL